MKHLILIILILAIIPLPVSAATITQNNTVTATIPRIDQGQEVALNDTIDISGACSDVTQIAWYGSYYDVVSPDGDTPAYILDLPVSSRGYYTFYLDPKIFGQRTGMWYKFYGNASHEQPSGNLQAFDVVVHMRNITLTANNTTTNITEYVNGTYKEPVVLINPDVIPEITEGDYLVARGNSLVVDAAPPSRVWLFGRIDGKYFRESINGSATFSAKEILSMEPGNYDVLIQRPGANTIYDWQWDEKMNLTPGLYGNDPIDITGIQPRFVLGKLMNLLPNTDDQFAVYDLVIQDPSISISSIDEMWKNNKTVLEVRGYTNVENGTRLKFVLDESEQTPRSLLTSTFYTEAKRTSPGNRSFYQIYIPIIFDDLHPGQHFVTAYTPQGSFSTVEWYIYNLPEGQEKPNETIKYVSGRYGDQEFVPTPTPITVIQTVVVPGPERIVTKEVTPRPEVVQEAQNKAISKKADEIIFYAALVVFVVALIWYLISLYLRKKELCD